MPGTVTIDPAALTVTASSRSVTYGDPVPSISASYSGFVGTDSVDSLATAPTCSTAYTPTSAPGTTPATSCTDAADANYTISYVPGQVTVTAAALTVTKSASSTTAVPGDTVTYTLTVTNEATATAAATNVSISDVVPAATLAHVASLSAQDSGTVTANGATWPTIASLGIGQSVSVHLLATLDGTFPVGTTTLTNTAVVTTPSDPTCQAGCSPTPPQTNVAAAPSLHVTKTVDKATAAPGDTIVYTITYENAGNADATGVTLADTLPAHLASVTASNSGVVTTGAVNWSLGTVAAGGHGTLTVTAVLDSVFPVGTTTLTNTAVVASPDEPTCATCTVPTPPQTTVTAGPKLGVTKTVDKATAAPGDTVVYTITYDNTGNADATGVTLADTLPAHLASVTASNSGVVTAGAVNWSIGTVAAGGHGTRTVTAVLDSVFPVGTTTLTNTAVVASPDEPSCVNCTVPTPPQTTVTAGPKLDVTKSVDKTTANPGDTLTYTITYDNTGNADATGVTLADTLPAHLASVTASNSGVVTTGAVNWSLGTVAAGTHGTLTVTAVLDGVFPVGTTTLTNTAVVASPDEPNCGTACDVPTPPQTTVTAGPKLGVTKTVDKATAAPGDTIVYTITYENAGNADATGVTLADTLPAHLASVTASNSGVVTTGAVNWSLGTVAAGGHGTLTVTAVLDSVFPVGTTTLTNTAVVASPDEPTCATCTVPTPPQTTVTAGPKLGVTKTVDKATAAPGDTVVYTITYDNTGNADATGVTLADTLPAHLASVTASNGGVVTTGAVNWSLGTVAAGGHGTLTVTAVLDGVFPVGTTTLTNTAVVASPDEPTCATCTVPNPPQTTVAAAPKLGVTKTVDKATAAPGDTVTYTITYDNAGNSDATGVTLADTLPAHLASVTASNGGVVTAGAVNWTLGTVPAGGSGTLTVTAVLDGVFPVGTTTLTNTAVVASPDEPTCVNCTVPTPPQTTVTAGPKLDVTKTVDKVTAAPGDTVVYTITYENTGNADATGVTLADTLPAHLASVTASNSGVVTAGAVNWSIGTVAAGGHGTLTVTAVLDGVFPVGTTTLTNTAVVASPDEPNCGTACDVPTPPQTTVTAGPKLGVTKTVDKTSAAPGDTVVYTITYENTGNADATGVTLADTLPAHLASVTASNSGVVTAGAVNWSLGTVAAGGHGTLTVTAVLDGVFPVGTTTLTNTAVVASPDEPTCVNCTVPTPPQTTVTAGPKLDVTKSVDKTTANPGDTLTYTITYENTGNADATGVTLHDTLPAHLATVTTDHSGAVTPGAVDWSLGTVAAGTHGTLTVTAVLDSAFPSGTTTLTNTAVVASPDEANCPTCTVPNPPTTTVTRFAVTVTVLPQTKVYDGTPEPTVCTVKGDDEATLTGTLSYAGVAPTVYASSATPPTTVGTYVATCDFAGDSSHDPGTGTALVTVNPAALVVTAEAKSKHFGQANPPLTATDSGLVGLDTLTSLGIGLTTTADVNSAVGTYPITVSTPVLANYTLTTHDALLTVDQAGVTVTVPPASKTYDGTPEPTSCTVTGVDGATLAGTLSYSGNAPTVYAASATAPTAAGSYTATCDFAGDPNHDPGTGTGLVTINPAALTVSAPSQTVTYGTPVPTITPSYEGFVNGDSVTSLATPANCSTTYTATTAPGATPDTTCTGAVDENYTITYEPGAITVTAASLSIVKSVDLATANPGDTLTYTLTVTNQGTATAAAKDVAISDTVPAGTMAYVASLAAEDGGTTTANGAVWPAVASLAPGQSVTVHLAVTLKTVFPAGDTELTNTALASSPSDPACVSGCAPAAPKTTVAAAPKLAVSKTVDKTTAAPGATVTYTITYDNTGNADATGVTLKDTLPAHLASVTASNGGTVGAGTVSWSLGTVAAGTHGTLTLTAVLDSVFPVGTTTLTNTAVVTSPDEPTCTTCTVPNPPQTTVTAAPLLNVTKSVDKTTANPGDTVTYTIGYSNVGNAAAAGVTLGDVLPAHTTFVSASNGGTNSSGTVSWTIGAVAPGAAGSVTVVAKLDAVFPSGTTPVTNTATIASPTEPGCGAGCASPVVTTTVTAGDLPACSIGYPFQSGEARTSIAFNESEVLRAFTLGTNPGVGDTIRVWYSDEHALTLGVRQISVKTPIGTTVTQYALTPMSSSPGSAMNPAVGATIGLDPSGRPLYPALFITDITHDAANTAGDWQHGGAPIPPDAIFGAWKGAVMTVDQTKTTPVTTISVDRDPAKNGWTLGTGSDAPPSGLTNQGYGTEVRWNVADLRLNGAPLQAGHTYRLEFMVHDGDQNKAGGDAGEGCLFATSKNQTAIPPVANDDHVLDPARHGAFRADGRDSCQ